MSLGKPEKLCRETKARGYRRAVKWAMRRKRRQVERADPENAPVKIGNYGWTE